MANEHLTARDTPLKAGDIAPDFTLPDQDRNEVSLSSLLADGRDVVLSFYPMAFTSVCGSEMACYTSDAGAFADRNAKVVGVSCDSFAANKAWRDQEKLGVPLLADMHRAVCRAFGAYFAPLNVAGRATFVIGPDRRIKWASVRELGQAVDNKEVLAALG